MSNYEILEETLNSGLLHRCCECQFKKMGSLEFMEDFEQDMVIIILEYDNNKLNDAYKHHWNAWLTRCIQNNIFSVNSPFYKKYTKYKNMSTELKYEENNEPDWDEE